MKINFPVHELHFLVLTYTIQEKCTSMLKSLSWAKRKFPMHVHPRLSQKITWIRKLLRHETFNSQLYTQHSTNFEK